MIDRTERIQTSAGMMDTFIVMPEVERPRAIILYMDVWGIREEIRSIARTVAETGYACLLPDLYYREGHVRHAFYDEKGRMRTLLSLTKEEQEDVRGPMRRLSDKMVMEDTNTLLSVTSNVMQVIGAVGYCMGGRHALLAGGTFPNDIKIAACLHGSNLVNDTELSPHKIASRITGEAYCGFAGRDPFGSPKIIKAIKSQFKQMGTKLTSVVHANAEHGYALPERDVYDAIATQKDWSAIYELLKRVPK